MSEMNVKELVELFSRSDIAELSYKDKDVELRLKKAGSTTVTAPVMQVPATMQAPAIIPAPTTAQATPVVPMDDPKIAIIKCPLVGTFYLSPAPGQPDFVQVGKKVSKGDTVCIVEAMKVMNAIESDVSGEVVEIMAESGALVEFGSPLIKIRTV
jgi:acetyl-CoA carboxylase biotin carboxyl carrier protein